MSLERGHGGIVTKAGSNRHLTHFRSSPDAGFPGDTPGTPGNHLSQGSADRSLRKAVSDMERPVKSTFYVATPPSGFRSGRNRRRSKRLTRRLITLIFADRPLRGAPS